MRVHLEITISASPERVREAILDERASWMPPVDSAEQPTVSDNRNPTLEWVVGGDVTRVDFRITPGSGGSRVVVFQEGTPTRGPAMPNFRDYWAVALENLRAVCESSDPVGLDRHVDARGSTRAAIEVDAPVTEVFDALTIPRQIERWFGTRAEVELEVGGRYTFLDWQGVGPVRILALSPPSTLTYSWHKEGEPETVVQWELESSGGATRVTIVHVGFGTRPTQDYFFGWLAYLVKLRRMLVAA